jgi:hypothetical protein
MSSKRSRFAGVLLAVVAIFALAGPASAAKSRHHRRQQTSKVRPKPKSHHSRQRLHRQQAGQER